jgi:hypothetical protein
MGRRARNGKKPKKERKKTGRKDSGTLRART